MAQFDVYQNPSLRSRDSMPYVVDVQSDLLSELRTRLVMPLSRVAVGFARPPRKLAPELTVKGERLSLQAQLAAGIEARFLGKPLTTLRAHQADILDALDAVVSGI